MSDAERIEKAIAYAQALALAGFGIVEAYPPAYGGGCTCAAGLDCPPSNWGKHPVGTGWQKKATRSPQTITERLKRRAGQYGVIPWPGERGLILDVDHPELLPVALPPSLRVRRGAERGHAYFRLPAGAAAATLPATADWGEVRVEGASRHVIGPWSRHAAGDVYEPTGEPDTIAEIPAGILAQLFPAELRDGPMQPPKPVGEMIEGDGRDNYLTSLAGSLRRPGFSQEGLEAALLVENRRYAEPLPEADVARIAHSIGKKAPAPVEPAPLLDPPPSVAERAEPVADLATYLAAVETFLLRYVAFPSGQEPLAVALWVAHAHLVDEFETSPILAITSAEMRSGKTRVLDCLELLVPNPLRMVTPSEAVVYTALAQRPRQTLLLDEADAVFSKAMTERYEGVRAILNAGNRKGTPVLRVAWVGKPRHREVEYLDVYGPKALAGIGKLPTTVADRAIPIRMKRRAPGELVTKFRERQAGTEAARIGFPGTLVTVVTGVEVSVPDQLNDRAADAWEPLVAVAQAAGEEWAARARLAAVALSGEDEAEVSVGIRLLADIRDAFDEQDTDHLLTANLLDALHGIDDAPWADWYGKPLSARALARLLEPYRVSPILKRLGGERRRGYFRSEFEDAWARYTLTPAPVTTVTPVTPTSGNGAAHDAELLQRIVDVTGGTLLPEVPA